MLAFTAPNGGIYGYGVLHALADAAPQLALALENAALVAERALRERLAALGQMAAVIVHEVKNPLGIIKVSAGALRQRARDDASSTLCRLHRGRGRSHGRDGAPPARAGASAAAARSSPPTSAR